MEIVNRDTFLSLPMNTLFSKYDPIGNFGELEIKVNDPGIWEPDFVSLQINSGWPLGCGSSHEFVDIMQRCEKGQEFKWDYETAGRDGHYDKGQLFAVYDQEDIERLINLLKTLQK